ncbi:hypothetical protein [Glycocaulis sp.]
MQGKFKEVGHFHIPAHRLAREKLTEMMKVLSAQMLNRDAEGMIACFLNSRGKNPPAAEFLFHVDYPEPGVVRTSMGGDFAVSVDEVVAPSKFRSGRE